jgi:hypothetical protein
MWKTGVENMGSQPSAARGGSLIGLRASHPPMISYSRTLIALAFVGSLGCGHRHEAHAVSPTPPEGLDGRAEEVARDASSSKNGQRTENPALRGIAYQDDDTKEWDVRLDDKHCYWFGGAGDAAIRKLSLYLWDPQDKTVTKDRSSRSTAVVTVCPTQTGRYRLQGKVAEGYGHFSVVIYASGAPERVAPPPEATMDSLIEDQAKSAAVGAARVGALYEGAGEKTDWFTPLEAGSCYWFIGAGEPKHVKKLSIYLWDPKDKRVSETFADSNTAMVGHCPTETGMYRFEAKVTSGSGHYKAAVYKKKN